MRKIIHLAIILLGSFESAVSQSAHAPLSIGVSVTPHIGGLWSNEVYGKSLGKGIIIGAHLIFDLNDRLAVLVGPSFQTADIANRANKLKWGDDNKNGEWQPGLSYEEYSVNYSSIGANVRFQWDFLKNSSRWHVSAGSGIRYILDYEDQLTINESGNLWEPEEIEADINHLQHIVNVGVNYSIPIRNKVILEIGPSIDFGLTKFLSSAPSTLFWSYKPTHPVFFGLQLMLRTR